MTKFPYFFNRAYLPLIKSYFKIKQESVFRYRNAMVDLSFNNDLIICNINKNFSLYRNVFLHTHATFEKYFLLLWRTFSCYCKCRNAKREKTFLAISWGLSVSLYPNFILILSWFYHLDRIWKNWVLSKLWMKSW